MREVSSKGDKYDKTMKEIIEFDPEKNPKAISIIQDKDGNWRGWINKFGKVIEVRAIGPETVLQLLLTHSGE